MYEFLFFMGLFVIFLVVYPPLANLWNNSFINQRTAKRLRKLGMELEMLSKYKGYKGYYRNYFFRVYAEKENTYTVNIIMYFRPNADDYGNIDYSQLYRIKSTYAPGIYSGYPCFFQAEVCCLLVQESRTWFTPFVALTRRLNWMVDIGIRENLIPLTEEEYERLLKADWELFAPPPGSLRDEKAPQVV